MLQHWFRATGGFRYSLKTQAGGSGNPALLHFLFKGPGGRVGYCEQFATAYAVMARTLQIPARVAVGFLAAAPRSQGRRVGLQRARPARLAGAVLPGIGLGAVRADAGDPRGDHAGRTPTRPVAQAHRPEVQPDPGRQGRHRVRERRPPSSRATRRRRSRRRPGTDIPWTWAPARARCAGRPRRAGAGPEVRTTFAADPATGGRGRGRLGRAPRQRRRPRGELARRPLAPRDGPPPGGLVRSRAGRAAAGASAARPRTGTRRRGRPGPDRAHARAGALRARPATTSPGALAEDVETCIAALEHGSMRSALRRATWLPRSLFGGRRRAAARAARDREPEAVAAGGVIDHVG